MLSFKKNTFLNKNLNDYCNRITQSYLRNITERTIHNNKPIMNLKVTFEDDPDDYTPKSSKLCWGVLFLFFTVSILSVHCHKKIKSN